MGSADYFLDGAWNFRCQECFKKMKSTEALLRWDGFWVGPECWEIRNPQDFIRGIPDNSSVPWSTGDPPPIFIDGSGSPVPQLHSRSRLLDGWMLYSTLLGVPPSTATTEGISQLLNSYMLDSSMLG